MKTAAMAKAHEPAAQCGGGDHDTFKSSNPPHNLIRTLSGRIISWPAGMERRYGFTSEQAIGSIAHELLNTTFPSPLHDIEATLLAHKSWSGSVIHRHADGRAVTAMSNWVLRSAGAEGEALVLETHTSTASLELADLLAIFANELSQPLTAIGNYINGARQTLTHRRADHELARKAMTLAGFR